MPYNTSLPNSELCRYKLVQTMNQILYEQGKGCVIPIPIPIVCHPPQAQAGQSERLTRRQPIRKAHKETANQKGSQGDSKKEGQGRNPNTKGGP